MAHQPIAEFLEAVCRLQEEVKGLKSIVEKNIVTPTIQIKIRHNKSDIAELMRLFNASEDEVQSVLNFAKAGLRADAIRSFALKRPGCYIETKVVRK